MRTEPRPKVIPGRGPLDIALEAACAAVLVGMWVYAAVSYSGLPDRIPVHFNYAGVPDNWGPRATVFLLPAVAVGVYAVMSLAGVIKPWYWNIPAVVTVENAGRVYRATGRLLRVVKLEAMILMALIVMLVVHSARHGRAWGAWAPLCAAGVMMLTVFVGMVRIRLAARDRTGGRDAASFRGVTQPAEPAGPAAPATTHRGA